MKQWTVWVYCLNSELPYCLNYAGVAKYPQKSGPDKRTFLWTGTFEAIMSTKCTYSAGGPLPATWFNAAHKISVYSDTVNFTTMAHNSAACRMWRRQNDDSWRVCIKHTTKTRCVAKRALHVDVSAVTDEKTLYIVPRFCRHCSGRQWRLPQMNCDRSHLSRRWQRLLSSWRSAEMVDDRGQMTWMGGALVSQYTLRLQLYMAWLYRWNLDQEYCK